MYNLHFIFSTYFSHIFVNIYMYINHEHGMCQKRVHCRPLNQCKFQCRLRLYVNWKIEFINITHTKTDVHNVLFMLQHNKFL